MHRVPFKLSYVLGFGIVCFEYHNTTWSVFKEMGNATSYYARYVYD